MKAIAIIVTAIFLTACRTVDTGGQIVNVTPFGTGAQGEVETPDGTQSAGAVNIVIVTGDATQEADKALTDLLNPAASTAVGTASESGEANR